jgi:hypothetical protein
MDNTHGIYFKGTPNTPLVLTNILNAKTRRQKQTEINRAINILVLLEI